ncbi:hypothetical protein Tco_0882379, partial [Tanacetum coccineum]
QKAWPNQIDLRHEINSLLKLYDGNNRSKVGGAADIDGSGFGDCWPLQHMNKIQIDIFLSGLWRWSTALTSSPDIDALGLFARMRELFVRTTVAYNTMVATGASPWNQTDASGSGDQYLWLGTGGVDERNTVQNLPSDMM